MNIPAGPCDRILAREFWLRGKRVSQVCVLFLRVSGEWFKVFFDDEDRMWKSSESQELPVSGQVEGDNHFRYPIVDLAQRHTIAVSEILDCSEEDLGNAARATIRFSDRHALILEHRYNDDSDTVRLVSV